MKMNLFEYNFYLIIFNNIFKYYYSFLKWKINKYTKEIKMEVNWIYWWDNVFEKTIIYRHILFT